MDSLKDVPKKVQYININSQFINGTKSNFYIDFGISSNIFIQQMNDVIGVKIVDFYVTQIGESSDGTDSVAKYIDIICPDIPLPGQILDERNGKILSRFTSERNFEGAGSGVNNKFIIHDRHTVGFNRKTNYFNPITIKKLNFNINVLRGDNTYSGLGDDKEFYFTLEITTIDHEAPPPDTNLRMLEAVEKLCKKIDRLNHNVKNIPKPEPKKKIPLRYVFIPLLIFLGWYYMKPKPAVVPQPMAMH